MRWQKIVNCCKKAVVKLRKEWGVIHDIEFTFQMSDLLMLIVIFVVINFDVKIKKKTVIQSFNRRNLVLLSLLSHLLCKNLYTWLLHLFFTMLISHHDMFVEVFILVTQSHVVKVIETIVHHRWVFDDQLFALVWVIVFSMKHIIKVFLVCLRDDVCLMITQCQSGNKICDQSQTVLDQEVVMSLRFRSGR